MCESFGSKNTKNLKKHFFIAFFIAINFIAGNVFSQTDTIINGKRYKIVEESKPGAKQKKKNTPTDSMFVYKNKKIKYYNNWITGGAGIQQNLNYKLPLGFAGGLDFNFHVKQHYFQLGTVITGEKFGFYNNFQLHAGYGKRHEDASYHFAGFVGISYSMGYSKVDSIYSNPYSKPGIYIQGEVIKKITYDVGIGVTLFADFNQEQSIIGARAILYFSGAYKGKKDENLR